MQLSAVSWSKEAPTWDQFFCIMSPKKGGLHTTLVPCLSRIFSPRKMDLEDLLKKECLVAMWHVYFDECKALEDPSGENELGLSKTPSWDADYTHLLKNSRKPRKFVLALRPNRI